MGILKSILGSAASLGGAIANIVAPGIGGQIAQAVGNSVGGILGQSSAQDDAKKAVADNNAFQLQLQQNQNNWNLQQWQRENAYNNPSAQLDRLKDAGLNPLFYGLDGNSSGTGLQSVTPTIQNETDALNLAQSAFSNQLQAQQVMADNMLKIAQGNNLDADAENKRVQSGKTKKETEWIDRLNENSVMLQQMQASLIPAQKAVYQKQADNLLASAQKMYSEIDLNEQQRQLNDITIQYFPAMKKAELQSLYSGIRNMQSQTSLNYRQRELLDFQEGLIKEEIELRKHQQDEVFWKAQGEKENARSTALTNEVRKETQESEIFATNVNNYVGTCLDNIGTLVGAVGDVVNVADKFKPSQVKPVHKHNVRMDAQYVGYRKYKNR